MRRSSIAILVALTMVAGTAPAAGLLFRLVTTTVNRLMITVLPPGEVNPSNMAVVDGDMMRASMEDQAAARMIHAGDAHAFATGRGVVVAVLDAGFDLSHPVLSGHLLDGIDTLDMDSDPNDLGNGYDDYGEGTPDNAVGHGNFVAGMVLLAAPDAMILPVRVMDDEGYGTNAAIARGLRFALDRGARIVNISARAATLLDTTDVQRALDEAAARGAVVVASAGNDGKRGLGLIAGDDRTVSVGAVDDTASVAAFSNTAGWGEELAVYAPGVDLEGPMTRGAMGVWSGTSFSAGLASGAAALCLELDPRSPPGCVRDRIAASVNPAYDARGRLCSAGVVDLLKVVTR
ncbi:MAG TPA: S8 family serine peptidase [Planctomycetota bacterium]|nr:S8 family serine peptidase [Planctomycetota bacterium]